MFKRVDELPIENKRVILRVDFNVPINPEGQIIDDTRIKSSLPTINYLLSKNCHIILLSHLGRPEGVDPNLSLKKIIPSLENLCHQKVFFYSSPDEAAKAPLKNLGPSISLIENLRFFKAEEDPESDPLFSKKIASLADYYIDDAFACCHRAHSSITELPKYFPNKKAAGFLLANEIYELKKVLNPTHPFYLLLGGSKVSTKIGVIKSLLPKAEAIFIGGAMAFPFLLALGKKCGSTQIDANQIEMAKNILDLGKSLHKEIYLPLDWKCRKINLTSGDYVICSDDGIPDSLQALDIDQKTIDFWKKVLINAKTIFWNGPLGMYETPPFDQGTAEIAKIIAKIPCQSVVGGGDSIAAIEKLGLSANFTHLSTGGGASLEFLENGTLPGIEALN